LHAIHDRATFDDTPEERAAFYEQMWARPGFGKLISHYTDMMIDPAANAEWCEFVAAKIRSVVDDPQTAERLIPKDHAFGEKRPPFVTNYYETYNKPNVELVSLAETPMVRLTADGIETTDGLREFDVLIWATAFDFSTGALSRMGIRGRDGRALTDAWADGPRTFLGIQTAGFPNFFFPGGPHAAAGNNPRYNGDQVDFVEGLLEYARDNGDDVVEVAPAAEEKWTAMIDRNAKRAGSFGESSYYFGTNVPGKPKKYLLNAAGRPKFHADVAAEVANGYPSFTLSRRA
jgi:cation diffusion facilitator CzcD-associated flavoprotein CzcO